jgi:hypothetical protein
MTNTIDLSDDELRGVTGGGGKKAPPKPDTPFGDLFRDEKESIRILLEGVEQGGRK